MIILILLIILVILGWILRTRPKCRDLGEISAFGTGSRLESNVFMHFPLFKLNIDNIDDIIDMDNIDSINNIGLILGLQPKMN